MVTDSSLSIIFAKHPILDVFQGSECTFQTRHNMALRIRNAFQFDLFRKVFVSPITFNNNLVVYLVKVSIL